MNPLLLKRKEFGEDKVRKMWKSYVKFLGVLKVKKPTDETVIHEMTFWCCATYVQFS